MLNTGFRGLFDMIIIVVFWAIMVVELVLTLFLLFPLGPVALWGLVLLGFTLWLFNKIATARGMKIDFSKYETNRADE